MALYFYRMEGRQPTLPVPRQVAMSGYYVQSRFITTPQDFDEALEKLSLEFEKRYPGATDYALSAFNRLDG